MTSKTENCDQNFSSKNPKSNIANFDKSQLNKFDSNSSEGYLLELNHDNLVKSRVRVGVR